MKMVLEYLEIARKNRYEFFGSDTLFLSPAEYYLHLIKVCDVLKLRQDEQEVVLCNLFYKKYYAATNKLFLIVGIKKGETIRLHLFLF